ncbi:MAG: hypothetical protein AB1515_03330 [Nitrospirota bacterium]
MRLDALCAALLCAGGVLLWLLPFRTGSYFIDWISGGFFGAMAGFSEGYLTVSRFRERLRDGTVGLRCRRGVPESTGSALALMAALALGLALIAAWPGPVVELTKTPLYLFNTLAGALAALWFVYLGTLLAWAIGRHRRSGRPVQVRCGAP